MTVYQLLGRPDDFPCLNTSETEDWEPEPHWFSGKPMSAEWVPPSLVIDSSGRKRRRMPFPDGSTILSIPVFTNRAVERLGDLLRANGELLPIHTPQGDLFAFNVLTLVDAFDEENSDVRRFPGGGIYSFRSYAFHADRLTDTSVFKIPEDHSGVYVTDAFVKRVQDAGLMGFRFKPLWPLPAAEVLT